MSDRMDDRDPKSITFITPFIRVGISRHESVYGGAERQCLLLGQQLGSRGWAVRFIVAREQETDDRPVFPFPTHQADFRYLGGTKRLLPADWISLWKALEKADTQYYVVRVPEHLIVPIAFFARRHKRKAVFWAQTDFSRQTVINMFASAAQWCRDRVLRRGVMIVAQTNDQRLFLLERYGVHAHVVPNIAPGYACGTEISGQGPRAEATDVLWVGNSLPLKRQELFFSIAEQLPHRSFTMILSSADTKRSEQAESYARERKNVRFLGPVPSAQITEHFRATQVLLCTSEREGFPNIFLQAWECGKPVVSLFVDPDQVIQRHGLGEAFGASPAMGPKEWGPIVREAAQRIESLLLSESKRAVIADNARLYVKQYHAPEKVLEHLLNAFHEEEGR